MKKINSFFGLVVLYSFFSFQSASCLIFGAIAHGVTKNIERAQQEDAYRMEEWNRRQEKKEELKIKSSQGLSAVTALDTSFSDKAFMAEKITGLINRKLKIEDKDVFLFPTPKLKISVLQNIEDFLPLPKGVSFYRYVYEECMKQIRTEENKLTSTTDDEGNVYFVDSNPHNKLIDDAYETYIQDYGVTKEKVKEHHNDVNWVKHKQFIVSKGLENLIWQSVEAGAVFLVENPVYQAHISILAYLIYWAGNKEASMMSADEVKAKVIEIESQKKEKKAQLKSVKEAIAENKRSNISHIPEIELKSSDNQRKQLLQKAGLGDQLVLSLAERIKKAQEPHQIKRAGGAASSTEKSYQVPKFTDQELPQNMSLGEQQEYAKKLEKLYPIRMNAWDKFKASIWHLFGY